MFLIGQTLNSSDPNVRTAMASGDLDWLRATAARQYETGVDAIDVNAGALAEHEAEIMRWLVPHLETATGRPLSIDSADADLLLQVGRSCRLSPLLNSFSLEHPWPQELAQLVRDGCAIVCQMRRRGWLPSSCDERLRYAEQCLERLAAMKIPAERVYLDPVLLPWGDDLSAGRGLLDFIERFDALPTLVGLSNVSFGHAHRCRVNGLWFTALRDRGLSAAIVDPFDPALMIAARGASS
ncbi:MAG TPA: dihydropteroate synthase [Candidatus Krumholzibacteria bacterium]